MPKKQKSLSLNRLSPTQLLLLLVFVLAVVGYQYWSERKSPTDGNPNTEVSQQQPNNEPTLTAEAPVSSMVITALPGDPTLSEQSSTAISASGTMSQFDYFVLALSWSPDYCATSGGDDPQQCSLGKKLGFVLHGLWPQNKQGYPSNCSTVKLTAEMKAQFAGLYPSENLYDHEWEKHGTCTGLSPVSYLTLSKQIKESVKIPAAFRSPEAPFRISATQLKQEFIQVNPGFTSTSFEVNCSGSGRYLKELYVCISRQGEPAVCGADVHKDALKSCQQANFLVRNTR